MVTELSESTWELAVRFTEGEWRTLQLAPVLAYQAVAEADGEIAEPETVALGRALMDNGHAEGAAELVRRVFTTAGQDLPALVQAWRGDPRSFDDGLRQAHAVLAEKAPGSQAAAFRRAVVDVAVAVAGAVGGVLPEESLAIGMVAAALGAEPRTPVSDAVAVSGGGVAVARAAACRAAGAAR
jgi:hypothetical protein